VHLFFFSSFTGCSISLPYHLAWLPTIFRTFLRLVRWSLQTLGRWVELVLKGDDRSGAGGAATAAAAAGEGQQLLAVLADGVSLCRLVQHLSHRPLTFRDAPASALSLYAPSPLPIPFSGGRGDWISPSHSFVWFLFAIRVDKLANVNAAMAVMQEEGIYCRGYLASGMRYPLLLLLRFPCAPT
jgi:hypothetical protein